MKKINRITLAALLCATLCLLSVFAASANSAQRYWKGTTATGAIITDGDCPIVVEHETLTLDLTSFPEQYYSENDTVDYSSCVTAAYTFYNPSDMSVTARLFFPFGTKPHYMPDDTPESEYTVTVDGSPIERTVRHTLSGYDEQFELSRDLGRLSDTPHADERFFPEQTVVCRTYRVEGLDRSVSASNIAFDLKPSDNVCILWPELTGAHTQSDGDIRLSAWSSDLDTFTLYIIGGDIEPQWTCYKNGGVKNNEVISGGATLVETSTTTLRTLALSKRPDDSPVSENDWYNAIIDRFNLHAPGSRVIGDTYNILDLSHTLMRWYEYSITLEPGQRITNTVKAPIYPSIDAGYEPSIYTYTYLLSPAATWKSFGTLDIKINTPYYLYLTKDDKSDPTSLASSLTETEDGYTLNLDELPEGELICALTPGPDPQPTHSGKFFLPIEIMITGGIALIIVAAAVVTVVIVCKKKSKKKSA